MPYGASLRMSSVFTFDTSRSRRDRETRRAPLGQPVLEPPRAEPARAEERDRLRREDAVRASAVRDDELVPGESAETAPRSVEGERDGARDVPGLVLLDRPDVYDHDVAPAETAEQIAPRHGLERVVALEVFARQALHLGQPGARDRAELGGEAADALVGGAVIDARAVAARVHQTGGFERLEVLRDVGDPHARRAPQGIDRALTLAEQLEELDPPRRGDRLADARELLVQGTAGLRWRAAHGATIFQYLLE